LVIDPKGKNVDCGCLRTGYCGESGDVSDKIAGNWRKLDEEEHKLYISLHIIVTKSEDKMGESFEDCMHIVGRKT
jgi:hypothetical protein